MKSTYSTITVQINKVQEFNRKWIQTCDQQHVCQYPWNSANSARSTWHKINRNKTI